MKKGRQGKQAAEEKAVGMGSRTGGSGCPVIVVGVGTPAGEPTSLKRLLARVPLGRGLAFVVIQHAGRSHAHLTVKGLRKQTALAVVEAEDGMAVLADCVHVVPPGKFLGIAQGRLSFHEPETCNDLRLPVDYFFCTLAVDQRDRSGGILLSGPSRDGTLGLSEIKAAGGRTIVQTPGSARVPNMPQSAIDAGVADAVLAPDDMAAAVLAFAAQVSANARSRSAEPPHLDDDLRAILETVHAKVGHDFKCYKPATLVRRVRRRLKLANIASYGEYARFLHEHPEEVGRLRQDLLIGVTEFFRQPQAWEFLEEKIIAGLVENAEADTVLRLWVPACSSGQEVYSLAMLMNERIDRAGKKVDFQLFATDTDLSALAKARAGVYAEEEIGPNMSAERLRRFFTLKDGRHSAAKALRQRIVFAPQNLTADPPFSRLDLVSCRNLLIYLEPPVQKKLIALFHFALRDGGFLFLGSVETVGDREDLFAPVSKKWRIYRRIGVGRRTEIEIPVRACEAPSASAWLPAVSAAPRLSLAAATRQALLERFAPACVLVDRNLQVLYTHGAIEQYLAFPGGELSTNIVTMAREGLRVRLRWAIGKCIEAGKSVALTARVRRGQKSIPVRTYVSPMHYPRETDGLLLIAFEDVRVPAAARKLAAGDSGIRQLEDELRITREELQSSIEQLENSNDQLKASNEEVTAANEELQSANEELETSKEELQSLNEELNTINARLQEKVDELEATTNDVINLLASTHIATVFLDKELRVKRYTPASVRLLSLIPTDVGRPMVDILRRFSDEALLDDAARVLADLTPHSKEVQADDGRWYVRRITPYRTQDDRIEGAVVTFADITDLQQGRREREIAVEFLQLVNRSTGTRDLTRLAVTFFQEQSGCEAVGIRLKEGDDYPYFEARGFPPEFVRMENSLCARDAAGEIIRDHMGNPLIECMCGNVIGGRFDPSKPFFTAGGSFWTNSTTELLASTAEADRQARTRNRCNGEGYESVALVPLGLGAARLGLLQLNDRRKGIFCAETIALWERLANHLAVALAKSRAEEQLQSTALFPEENPFPILRVGRDGNLLYANRSAAGLLELWGCRPGTPVPEFVQHTLANALGNGTPQELEIRCNDRDLSFMLIPIVDRNYVNFYGRDITERKRAEQDLRLSEERLKRAQAIAHLGSWELDLVNHALTWSDEVYRLFGLQPQEFGATYAAFLERVHPEDRAAVDAAYSGSLRENRDAYEIEHRVVRKDTGDILVVHERCQHYRDASGKIVRSVGMVQDITERKRAAESILRAKEEWERTFNAVPDLVAILDNHHRIVRVNQAMADRLGTTPDQCAGLMCYESVHGLSSAPAFCPHALTCKDGEQHVVEVHEPRLGGDFLVSATPLCDAKGKLIGAVHIARDISAHKQAERALRDSQLALSKANEGLEQTVRERTAALTLTVGRLQEEVEQRQRAEDEFRRANEQLNARAAQLRALAGELTMVEQRERKRMAQILHDHLQQQLASAKLQVSCLDELDGEALVLAATQIEELLGESIRLSRSLTAELSPPILHEAGMAAGFAWLSRWMADKHGLKVDLAMPEPLPAVAEDVKVLLFESTRELLFNAAKHARVASAKVGLSQIEGKTLQITVSDNGPGFDPAKMKQLGESGAGFGLFSIRERLDLIGGKLEIDSAPGRGSRIFLTAPLLQTKAAVEPTEARREASPVSAPEPSAQIRVLLADDHAVMRQSLALMLSQEPDIEVVGEAQDGGEAVELAGKLRPDVILMDISMPGVNGIDATRSINDAYPEICVIGLSMHEEGERSQAIRSAGATDYVTKSAPKAHLVAAIRGCMRDGSG